MKPTQLGRPVSEAGRAPVHEPQRGVPGPVALLEEEGLVFDHQQLHVVAALGHHQGLLLGQELVDDVLDQRVLVDDRLLDAAPGRRLDLRPGFGCLGARRGCG